MNTYNSKLKSKEMDDLFDAILSLNNREECYKFFEDICTINELLSMAQRLSIAKCLRNNTKWIEIEKKTYASSATISKVNKSIQGGQGGYNLILDRLIENK
ncbi:YerC/YecD family TrpR-related protein [Helicovermis profundi]|uniref:YerC/YecD family TrpR-related protein n=1 Tax=Helicovermis profundi TaxID=3065157 RepID=A0AAU9E676_9FIRM|nr:YerC/YecD family TrpR-related protein [Clostridia bacterium S502]